LINIRQLNDARMLLRAMQWKGVLLSRDLTGYGIAFKVADVMPPAERELRRNTPTRIDRLNEVLTSY
jgi:hypothetical protein